MADETNTQSNTPSGAQSDLIKELNRLGDNLSNLFKVLWESEERKSVEREVTAGLEQLNKQVKDTAEKIRKDSVTEQISKGVKDAWETARGPQILNEVQQGITDTLHKLNEEIGKRAQPAQEVEVKAGAAKDIVDAAADTAKGAADKAADAVQGAADRLKE